VAAELRTRLYLHTGRFQAEDMVALAEKEDWMKGRAAAYQGRVEDLNRRIAAAILEADFDATGKRRRGKYVPRVKPWDFVDWPIWQRNIWLAKEEIRKLESDAWELEEMPADFAEWPLVKQLMWLRKQALAREALAQGRAKVTYFTGRALGFSEISLSWRWTHTAKGVRFFVYRNDDFENLKQVIVHGASAAIAVVDAAFGQLEYKNIRCPGLTGGREYTFGVVAEVDDGGGRKITLPVETHSCSTEATPMVASLTAKTVSFAEIELSWDFENRAFSNTCCGSNAFKHLLWFKRFQTLVATASRRAGRDLHDLPTGRGRGDGVDLRHPGDQGGPLRRPALPALAARGVRVHLRRGHHDGERLRAADADRGWRDGGGAGGGRAQRDDEGLRRDLARMEVGEQGRREEVRRLPQRRRHHGDPGHLRQERHVQLRPRGV
jgi:hypothetical protein